MLGLKYIDLYLLHWPKFYDCAGKRKTNIMPMHILWPLIENLVTKGYTKYIGVSNFSVQSLLNLLSFCKIKPLVNELELHPYLYQKKLVEFCRKENILTFAIINLIIAVFNLLPANALDGGIVLKKILMLFFNENKTNIILNIITVIFGMVIFVLGVFLVLNSNNFSLIIISLYLLISVLLKL